MGVVCLGIPQNFDLNDTQGMWDFLQQPYANPTWRYLTDPDLIEKILIKWQRLHYTQAVDTPLAKPSWSNKRDPTTITRREIQQILHDTIDHDHGHEPATNSLLHHLKTNIIPPMPELFSSITVDKFRSFYLRTKERTSSSPSGIHLGH